MEKTIKKKSVKKTFKDKRISVMNHDDKTREKKELNQMIDLLRENSNNRRVWESELREPSASPKKVRQN